MPDLSIDDASRAARLAWLLSAAATVVWLVAVLLGGSMGRVVDNWKSALTMLFGSFLAGSSPEGGSAVAYPVFTKGLHIPGPVARSFGLSIQAVGMGMATIAIVLTRRRVHVQAAIAGSVAAVVGFLGAIAVFGEPSEPFWPLSIGTPWVKATFSIVLATTSVLMIVHLRHGERGHEDRVAWSNRHTYGLIIVALAGGVLSSLAGTGANILVFLFLVSVADIQPKVALPTALIVMTAVSIVGFGLFGLIDGQLNVDIVADRVVAVGGQAVDLEASRTDMFGLWLAAVPVVVWGAPLGSWAASLVKERHLVRFVAALAITEVITTFVLVEELRTDVALIAYLVVGLPVLPALFLVCRAKRFTWFA